MNAASWALLGLAAGLGAGAAIAASARPGLLGLGAAIEVVGALWINAILMTIIPLVVSKLVVSIAGEADRRSLGRAGWRAVAWFLGLLFAGAALSAAVMPGVFSWLSIDPAASAALRARVAAPAAAAAPLSVSQSVLALVPTNAVRAAADNAIVPLLVFFVVFALGARRIPDDLRRPLVQLFRAVDAAISVVLRWIVMLSPIGIFALGLGLAMRIGVGIIGALGYYVAVSSMAILVFTALLYLVVFAGARISPVRFARAAAPAQIVAFSTHSSMASLPAMIEGVEVRLGLPPAATGFVLPLSLALFKCSGPVWFVVVTCFVARLYGVALDPSRTVAIVFAAVVTSFAVGGVPSGAVAVVAPVLTAAGLPVEAIGVLLAVDPIPNAFRTLANVTGMMAVTALADSGTRDGGPGTRD